MRILFFKYSLTILLILLLGGLFYTQIIQGEYFADLGENNRIRLLPITAPRGRILDCHGKVLAGNRPSYNVYWIARDFNPELTPWLEGILELPQGSLSAKLVSKKMSSYLPVPLKQDVSKEVVFQIQERKPDLTGVFVTVEGRRYYPLAEMTGHITGYLGKISEEEYGSGEGKYNLNDLIGRAGLEKVFDGSLRGENGGRQVEVNSRGEVIRTLGERKPIPGKDLVLSLDSDVQKIMWDEIKDHPNKLSVGVMDLNTGGMVGMVSKPSYDPNIFVSGGRSGERMELLKDKSYPMVNRFISAGYPAGSIFKLVTATAGLETKKITPTSSFTCTGTFSIGSANHIFHCWNKYGHGTLALPDALTQSCNVYFYNVGRIVGEEAIARAARLFALNEKPGIELPAVFEGLVPDDAWKRREMKDRWYQGETISYAIGQSYLMVSPLQILRLVSTFAKHGVLPDVTLLKEKPAPSKKLAVNPKTIEVIRAAMENVVESDRGTGKYARVPFMKMGAKTGTAQNPTGKSHAWFAGFFPFETPRYAMVTMIEEGGAGGMAAGTLTKEIVVNWHSEKGSQFV